MGHCICNSPLWQNQTNYFGAMCSMSINKATIKTIQLNMKDYDGCGLEFMAPKML